MLFKFPSLLPIPSRQSAGQFICSLIMLLSLTIGTSFLAAPAVNHAKPAPPKPAEKPKIDKAKDDKATNPTVTPEPVLENLTTVKPEDLVGKATEYVAKNVKFDANFFAFSNLALD